MSFRRFPFHMSDADSFDRMNSRSEESRNMFQETSSSSRRNDWQQNESHFEEPLWRAHSPPFRHSTNSVPGSPRGVRGWPSTGIPIKVIHETKKSDSETSREYSSCTQEGSQSSSTQSPREPRVHHIPIMVEPRDGTSSGYVSDSGSEKSMDTSQKRDRDLQEERVKRSNSDNKVNGPSQHSENVTTHEASKAAKTSEGVRKPHVHHIPITVEPRAGDVPLGKPNLARKQSPLHHAFPPRASSEAQPFDGPVFSSRKTDSTSSAEQQRVSAKKNIGKTGNGPHVTKIPINVSTDQSSQTTSPANPAEVALNQIAKIDSEVAELRKQVDAFRGTNQDKKYRYLDEMLTRCMLKLDNIDTIGMDAIRKSRKLVINKVQECISLLESKLVGSKGTAELTNARSSDSSDAIRTDNIVVSIEEESGASENKLNKSAETNVENVSESLQTNAASNQMTKLDKSTARTNEAEEKMDIDKQAEPESSKNQNSCETSFSTNVDKDSDAPSTEAVEINKDASGPKSDLAEADKGTSESKTGSMDVEKEINIPPADKVESGRDATEAKTDTVDIGKGTSSSKSGSMEVEKETDIPPAVKLETGKDTGGSCDAMEIDKEASAFKAD